MVFIGTQMETHQFILHILGTTILTLRVVRESILILYLIKFFNDRYYLKLVAYYHINN